MEEEDILEDGEQPHRAFTPFPPHLMPRYCPKVRHACLHVDNPTLFTVLSLILVLTYCAQTLVLRLAPHAAHAHALTGQWAQLIVEQNPIPVGRIGLPGRSHVRANLWT